MNLSEHVYQSSLREELSSQHQGGHLAINVVLPFHLQVPTLKTHLHSGTLLLPVFSAVVDVNTPGPSPLTPDRFLNQSKLGSDSPLTVFP